MKLALRQIGAAMLTIAISVPAQQSTPETSPTLQETNEWLKTSVEGYGGGCYNQYYRQEISEVNIDNSCNLRYKTIMHFTDKNKVWRNWMSSVPLGAVNQVTLEQLSSPGSGCADWWEIGIKTGNLATAFDGSSPTSVLRIMINEQPRAAAGGIEPQTPQQMAPRIQKALQHAVELCRGTYHSPPQTKEPF